MLLFQNGDGKGNNFTELVLCLSNTASLPPPFLRSSRDLLVKEVTVLRSPYRWRCCGVGGCSALSHVTLWARGSLEESFHSGLCEPDLVLAIITNTDLMEEHPLRNSWLLVISAFSSPLLVVLYQNNNLFVKLTPLC